MPEGIQYNTYCVKNCLCYTIGRIFLQNGPTQLVIFFILFQNCSYLQQYFSPFGLCMLPETWSSFMLTGQSCKYTKMSVGGRHREDLMVHQFTLWLDPTTGGPASFLCSWNICSTCCFHTSRFSSMQL